MWLGAALFLVGLGLVLWGAERFTDGALATAARFAVSPFVIGVLVSGFEPENLATGVAATVEGLGQIALGTVIGAAIFLLTGGLGLALLLVPMEVGIPRAGGLTMLLALVPFAVGLGLDGAVSRLDGALLVVAAVVLLAWLYRSAPAFLGTPSPEPGRPALRARALGLLAVGLVALVLGAELAVWGAGLLIGTLGLSETVFGMTVVALGESLEETARMVGPARRGHPELAWGNVVGTTIVLLGLNLGIIALVRPVTADPLVLRLHAPYLAGCVLLVGAVLLGARRLGRGTGALLIGLYLGYLALNLPHLFRG